MTGIEAVLFALAAIKEIVAAATAAAEGSISPEAALEKMKAAVGSPAGIDARVDAELAKKFPPKEEP